MQVGCIYFHDAFYTDSTTGEVRSKYLIILALPPGGDVVFRLLTSRHASLRPAGCFHGMPYPGFALGVPGGRLTQPTWVDLREQDDYDADAFKGRVSRGVLSAVDDVAKGVLRNLLTCAANADGTTRQQSRHILDTISTLGP